MARLLVDQLENEQPIGQPDRFERGIGSFPTERVIDETLVELGRTDAPIELARVRTELTQLPDGPSQATPEALDAATTERLKAELTAQIERDIQAFTASLDRSGNLWTRATRLAPKLRAWWRKREVRWTRLGLSLGLGIYTIGAAITGAWTVALSVLGLRTLIGSVSAFVASQDLQERTERQRQTQSVAKTLADPATPQLEAQSSIWNQPVATLWGRAKAALKTFVTDDALDGSDEAISQLTAKGARDLIGESISPVASTIQTTRSEAELRVSLAARMATEQIGRLSPERYARYTAAIRGRLVKLGIEPTAEAVRDRLIQGLSLNVIRLDRELADRQRRAEQRVKTSATVAALTGFWTGDRTGLFERVADLAPDVLEAQVAAPTLVGFGAPTVSVGAGDLAEPAWLPEGEPGQPLVAHREDPNLLANLGEGSVPDVNTLSIEDFTTETNPHTASIYARLQQAIGEARTSGTTEALTEFFPATPLDIPRPDLGGLTLAEYLTAHWDEFQTLEGRDQLHQLYLGANLDEPFESGPAPTLAVGAPTPAGVGAAEPSFQMQVQRQNFAEFTLDRTSLGGISMAERLALAIEESRQDGNNSALFRAIRVLRLSGVQLHGVDIDKLGYDFDQHGLGDYLRAHPEIATDEEQLYKLLSLKAGALADPTLNADGSWNIDAMYAAQTDSLTEISQSAIGESGAVSAPAVGSVETVTETPDAGLPDSANQPIEPIVDQSPADLEQVVGSETGGGIGGGVSAPSAAAEIGPLEVVTAPATAAAAEVTLTAGSGGVADGLEATAEATSTTDEPTGLADLDSAQDVTAEHKQLIARAAAGSDVIGNAYRDDDFARLNFSTKLARGDFEVTEVRQTADGRTIVKLFDDGLNARDIDVVGSTREVTLTLDSEGTIRAAEHGFVTPTEALSAPVDPVPASVPVEPAAQDVNTDVSAPPATEEQPLEAPDDVQEPAKQETPSLLLRDRDEQPLEAPEGI